MKTVIKQTYELTLTLNEEEAAWLRQLVQNPQGDYTPASEPPEERGMRRRFWEALNVA